jgi:hypothetical protein
VEPALPAVFCGLLLEPSSPLHAVNVKNAIETNDSEPKPAVRNFMRAT